MPKSFVFPGVLHNGEETYWILHEVPVENHLILCTAQFEDGAGRTLRPRARSIFSPVAKISSAISRAGHPLTPFFPSRRFKTRPRRFEGDWRAVSGSTLLKSL